MWKILMTMMVLASGCNNSRSSLTNEKIDVEPIAPLDGSLQDEGASTPTNISRSFLHCDNIILESESSPLRKVGCGVYSSSSDEADSVGSDADWQYQVLPQVTVQKTTNPPGSKWNVYFVVEGETKEKVTSAMTSFLVSAELESGQTQTGAAPKEGSDQNLLLSRHDFPNLERCPAGYEEVRTSLLDSDFIKEELKPILSHESGQFWIWSWFGLQNQEFVANYIPITEFEATKDEKVEIRREAIYDHGLNQSFNVDDPKYNNRKAYQICAYPEVIDTWEDLYLN